jgi:hypothetical protein
MARFQRLCIDVVDIVRVEDTRFGTAENGLFAGGIGETETTPTVLQHAELAHKFPCGFHRKERETFVWLEGLLGDGGGEENVLWLFTGRAHNGYTLRHHDLIPDMRVQVSTTHKARLTWMRMYPTQYHQLLRVAVVEQIALIGHFTRIARAGLRWYD